VLLCLSSNHRNATFELLESLSLAAPGATTALLDSSELVTGAVVLATCNRFEAYLDVDEPQGVAAGTALASTLATLSDSSGLSVDALRASITVHEGPDVAAHLFSVTAGLESVVVGEDEIAGQVGRALDRARSGKTTTRDLEQLFQRATHTSRGVKNLTSIGGRDRSLVRLALELASSRIADWSQASVLIVGTGQYAATTVAALRDRGARDIRVFSRTGRGPAFAAKHRVTNSGDFEVDVVIACTANTVLGPDYFPGTSRRLVIDLGLPRNIEPVVAGIQGIELLDLETVRLHAPLDALSAHDDATAIVRSAAAEFTAERDIEPAIVALRTHVFDLLDAEIARARARGAGDETESALRHLAGVLLHAPSARARDLALGGRSTEFRAGLEAVYGITPKPRVKDAAESAESAESA
jgi:glutamyl-tRNA reductase